MAKDVTLVYNGPQVRVVELDREVVDGDEVTVTPELAPKLLAASGFREKGKRQSAAETSLASRSVLEERATALGLQLYPTETDEGLAGRVREHGGSSAPGDEPAPTPAASNEEGSED